MGAIYKLLNAGTHLWKEVPERVLTWFKGGSVGAEISPVHANFFLNTGHGTLGWTMSAGSGRLIADLISGRAPDIAAEDLGYARYLRGAARPRTGMLQPVGA